MRKGFAFLTIAVILATALAACGATAYECEDRWGCVVIEDGQTIQIAYVGPMTGDYSAFGIDISRGVELAVVDNPEVKGFEIEVLIEDTQGTPEQGAAVANKLAAEARLVGVAGHTFSGSTEAAIPVYEDAHIVMVSPSTSSTLGRWARTDSMNEMFAWSTPSLPERRSRSRRTAVSVPVTNPSTSSRCSMIGTACASPIQLMPNAALSTSPPEARSTGSSDAVRRAPLSEVVFPAMSWALKAVR